MFFQIGRQIIVVVPIGDDVFIDLTADRIIGVERITVFPARREDRLIDAILSHAMGQVTADGQLIVMFIAHRPQDIASDISGSRTLNAAPAVLTLVDIGIVVKISQLIAMEVQGIRKARPAAAEEVRIKQLQGHRDPAAGRTAGQDPSFRHADAAVLLLDCRDDFLDKGITPGTQVLRVDQVGVIIKHIRMTEIDADDLRCLAGIPILGKTLFSFP